MQVSQSVIKDFPDLRLPSGLEVISGLLCVPLSRGGKDFIAFLRKGQLRDVHWAGKPFKQGEGDTAHLEPRKSFKVRSYDIVILILYINGYYRFGQRRSQDGAGLGQTSNWRRLAS